MRTYRIVLPNGGSPSLDSSPARPVSTWVNKTCTEFPTRDTAARAAARIILAAHDAEMPATGDSYAASLIEPMEWTTGLDVWEAGERLKRTALWILPLLVEDAPAHLFNVNEGVKS